MNNDWLAVSKIFYSPFHIWDVILPDGQNMLKPPSRMMVKTTGNLGVFSPPDPENEVWAQYLHRGLVDFWLSS